MNGKAKVPTISVIPDESIDFGKVYYHCVYFMLNFNKDGGFDSKGDEADMDPYPNEE